MQGNNQQGFIPPPPLSIKIPDFRCSLIPLPVFIRGLAQKSYQDLQQQIHLLFIYF